FVVQAVLAAPMVDVPFYGAMDAWRLIFVWVAAPGLLIALLMLTVREPLRRGRRAALPSATASAAAAPGLIAHLRAPRAALGALFGGMSLIGLVMYGVIAWIPTFFARTYDMEI